MLVLRFLTISVLAPILGSTLLSLILFGGVERTSFIPLIFALPGSFLLLGPAYATLRERGTPIALCYAALVAIGMFGGAAMLGLFETSAAMLGALYGATTALFWIGLHALSALVLRRRVAEMKAS